VALENLKNVFTQTPITNNVEQYIPVEVRSVINTFQAVDEGSYVSIHQTSLGSSLTIPENSLYDLDQPQSVDFFEGKGSPYYPQLNAPILGFTMNFNQPGFSLGPGQIGDSQLASAESNLSTVQNYPYSLQNTVEFSLTPTLAQRGRDYEFEGRGAGPDGDDRLRQGLGWANDVINSPLLGAAATAGVFGDTFASDLQDIQNYESQIQAGKQVIDSIRQGTFGINEFNNVFGPIEFGTNPPQIRIPIGKVNYTDQLFEGGPPIGTGGHYGNSSGTLSNWIPDDAAAAPGMAGMYRGNAFQVKGENDSPLFNTQWFLDGNDSGEVEYSPVGKGFKAGFRYSEQRQVAEFGNFTQANGAINKSPVDRNSPREAQIVLSGDIVGAGSRTIADDVLQVSTEEALASKVNGPYDSFTPFPQYDSIHPQINNKSFLYKQPLFSSVHTKGYPSMKFDFLKPLDAEFLTISWDQQAFDNTIDALEQGLENLWQGVKNSIDKLIPDARVDLAPDQVKLFNYLKENDMFPGSFKPGSIFSGGKFNIEIDEAKFANLKKIKIPSFDLGKMNLSGKLSDIIKIDFFDDNFNINVPDLFKGMKLPKIFGRKKSENKEASKLAAAFGKGFTWAKGAGTFTLGMLGKGAALTNDILAPDWLFGEGVTLTSGLGSLGSTLGGAASDTIDFFKNDFPKYNPIKFDIELPKADFQRILQGNKTLTGTSNKAVNEAKYIAHQTDKSKPLDKPTPGFYGNNHNEFGIKPLGKPPQKLIDDANSLIKFKVNFFNRNYDKDGGWSEAHQFPKTRVQDSKYDPNANDNAGNSKLVENGQFMQMQSANSIRRGDTKLRSGETRFSAQQAITDFNFLGEGQPLEESNYNSSANSGAGNSQLVTDKKNKTNNDDPNTLPKRMSRPKGGLANLLSSLTTFDPTGAAEDDADDRFFEENADQPTYDTIDQDKYIDSTNYYPSRLGGDNKSDGMTVSPIRRGASLNSTYGALGSNPIESAKNGYPFYIKDLRDSSYIIFRAYIEALTEDYTPNWSPVNYIGRSEPVYMYERGERSVTFTLKLFASSPLELNSIYEKMNHLSSLCYPEYKADKLLDNKLRMKPPLATFRIGELFGSNSFNQVCFIRSLNFSYPDSSPWEFRSGHRVPKHILATIGLAILHTEGNNSFPANKNTKFYGYNDLAQGLGGVPGVDGIDMDIESFPNESPASEIG